MYLPVVIFDQRLLNPVFEVFVLKIETIGMIMDKIIITLRTINPFFDFFFEVSISVIY